MTAARFITFEGGEGAGKSTQIARLAEALAARGISAVSTREPGGSPFAERLRDVILNPDTEQHSALAESLLFYAARADHLEHTIRPALDGGRWVLCDRFTDSTRVYQGHAGKLDIGILDDLDRIVVGATRPDLTLVLDIDPAVGIARVERRRQDRAKAKSDHEADRFEGRTLSFHEALREGFRKLAKMEPDRCVLINAHEPVDEIAQAVWKAVDRRLLQGA